MRPPVQGSSQRTQRRKATKTTARGAGIGGGAVLISAPLLGGGGAPRSGMTERAVVWTSVSPTKVGVQKGIRTACLLLWAPACAGEAERCGGRGRCLTSVARITSGSGASHSRASLPWRRQGGRAPRHRRQRYWRRREFCNRHRRWICSAKDFEIGGVQLFSSCRTKSVYRHRIP